jgi:hypothetical protein
MLFLQPRRLAIRDFRIGLAAVGATAASIAASASLWSEPHALRLVALAAGALLATLTYEPLQRVARPPQFVVTLADWAPIVGMGAVLLLGTASGLPSALNVAAWFAGGAALFASLIVRDWLYFTVVRENV